MEGDRGLDEGHHRCDKTARDKLEVYDEGKGGYAKLVGDGATTKEAKRARLRE